MEFAVAVLLLEERHVQQLTEFFHERRIVQFRSVPEISKSRINHFVAVLKPMTTKIKITMNKSNSGNIANCLTDVIVQDCNIQMCKEQYDSILAVGDSLRRILTSWNFITLRPRERILENKKNWWKYAYLAVLEQRVRPYAWKNIRNVRQHYRGYMQTYKQIILNPNDTELKLDLQKYEDNLSIVNIVIARQQARLLVLVYKF
jgi:vacuolar protein sorting-associated protein 13A/C